jgi:hypothetical protein
MGIVVLFILSVRSQSVTAQSNIEDVVKLSQVTISALECSLLADGDEKKIVFLFGVAAGRKFWEGMTKLSGDELRTIAPKIDNLWRTVKTGTDPEFQLGGIYEALREEMESSFVREGGNSTVVRQRLYRKKNCAMFRP